jgi:tRNA uridine 5-carbamoylmethylation protein Kti12
MIFLIVLIMCYKYYCFLYILVKLDVFGFLKKKTRTTVFCTLVLVSVLYTRKEGPDPNRAWSERTLAISSSASLRLG